MTEEILERANDLAHDIKILDEIKTHQLKNHWVAFRVPNGSLSEDLDDFWSDDINNAFKEFVDGELKKALKALEDL